MKRNSIIFLCYIVCILCACSDNGNAVRYNICENKVRITEIYLNNAEGFKCNEDNPYREQMLSIIELISQKETREPTEVDFEPEITLIASNGTTFELSLSVTVYEYPDAEGIEYENQDDTAYYIRILRDGHKQTFYYECDDDVGQLRRLMNDAVSYEYTNLGTVTGVVRDMGSNADGKYCYIVSSEYGDFRVQVDDFDDVIVGDTVEVDIREKTDTADVLSNCEGTIHNLTKNDVTATSEEYLTVLSFTYNIMSYEGDFENNVFQTNQLELECDKEEFDFLLDWWENDLPSDIIQNLQSKYDEDFFANHILLYCGLDTSDVQVTAVVQTKWVGNPNIVYVKKSAEAKMSDGKYHILWIEIPKEGWNEYTFGLYLFE